MESETDAEFVERASRTPTMLTKQALTAFAYASNLGIIPDDGKRWDDDLWNGMNAAIALVRREALEEAASAMEQRTLRLRTIYAKQNNQKLAPCKDAAAIRALKEKV